MQPSSNFQFSRVRWVGAALVALWCCVGCSRAPNEQALRETLDAMQEAGETRDVGDFMTSVAEDFVGNSAEYDRRGLEQLLRMIAMQHQSLSVVRTGLTIEMHGDRAVVRMQILISGGSGGWVPDSGQLLDTESAWRFVDGEWQVGSATWKPVR